MKLKIIDITISDLIKLTNRFLDLNRIYTNTSEKIFKYISIEYVKKNLDTPIIIFLNNEFYFLDRQVISAEGIDSLYSIISVDINDILNIKQLLIYKAIYENGFKNELQNMQTKIIFIERTRVDNFSYRKVDLLIDLLLFTKNNTNTIDTKLLDKIFIEDDKKMLKHKFELSIAKHFFPQKRRQTQIKKDTITNPWLKLYLEKNTQYLSLKNTIKKSKKLKIIHCPICAKEHKIVNEVVYINDDKIYFNCSHKNTQFLKYEQFSISVNKFAGEDFSHVSSIDLIKFIKHNIQPTIINNVYMIKISSSDKIEYLPLKIFLKVPQINLNYMIDDTTSILKTFYCPICSKTHFIYFTNKNKEDYIDLSGNKYIHYEKKFQQNSHNIMA